MAISSFKSSDVQALFEGKGAPRFGGLEAPALRKLAMIHRAATLDDLKAPPGFHLKHHPGEQADLYSVQVSDRWRLRFCWAEAGPDPLKDRIKTRRFPMRDIPYPTPGEILHLEFLEPLGISQYKLAKAIGVPQRRIGEIVAGKRAITVDTGLRLSKYFGLSDSFWIGLQMDFEAAQVKGELADALGKIQPLQR